MVKRLILWCVVLAPLLFLAMVAWALGREIGVLLPLGAVALAALSYAAQTRRLVVEHRRRLATVRAALPAEESARGAYMLAQQREVATRWSAMNAPASLNAWDAMVRMSIHALAATLGVVAALWLSIFAVYLFLLGGRLWMSSYAALRVLSTLTAGGWLLPLIPLYMAALSLWRREVVQPAQQARALRGCAHEMNALIELSGGLTLAEHEMDGALRGALSQDLGAGGQLEQVGR